MVVVVGIEAVRLLIEGIPRHINGPVKHPTKTFSYESLFHDSIYGSMISKQLIQLLLTIVVAIDNCC